MDNIITFAHQILEKKVSKGSSVIDATCGNGHDTLFLARLVGSTGKVYGFDIQPAAIMATEKKLAEYNLSNIAKLFCINHNEIKNIVKEKVAGAIFNLGYLPGSDKSICTQAHFTIAAIEQILNILELDKVIVVIVYLGHNEGKLEQSKIEQFALSLSQKRVSVLKYQFINRINNAPYILIFEKIAD